MKKVENHYIKVGGITERNMVKVVKKYGMKEILFILEILLMESNLVKVNMNIMEIFMKVILREVCIMVMENIIMLILEKYMRANLSIIMQKEKV